MTTPKLHSEFLENLEYVDFNPDLASHQKAFTQLIYFGKQHPRLRFNLKGYNSVPEMMWGMLKERGVDSSFPKP